MNRDELARMARKQIQAETGRAIPLKFAETVVRDILGDRYPDNPAKYIEAAIRRNPGRFLPSDGPGGRPVTPPMPDIDPDDVIAYRDAYRDGLRQSNSTDAPEADGEELADDPEAGPTAEPAKKTGQAAELVTLAGFRYRMVQSADRRMYAVPLTGPAIVVPLRGPSGLKARLAKIYAQEHPGSVASSNALGDAMTVLEGHATDNDPEPVHLRTARHAGSIVLDLGAADGRCVIVGPGGWRVANEPPVLFRRSQLTSVIPEPVRIANGLRRLRSLLNVDETDFRQIVGWLVCGLIPDLAHPVLALRGEQGTAKSTAARMLTMLIDPSPAPLRSAPRDLKQWAISATASWVVVLDNVSSIPTWLSDALCRAVTGEAFIDRALYSDDDVTVLSYRRVIALTSIGTGNLAGDLAERMLLVELQPIPDRRRRSETEVREAFEAARPVILGALLDLLSTVLASLPGIKLPQLPRMADFARVLAALDQTNGWSTLADYASSAEATAAEVLETSSFAVAVRDFTRQHTKWTGTASQLLDQLPKPDPAVKGWPPDATRVGHLLSQFAPALRQQGVEVDKGRAGNKRNARLISLSLSSTQMKRKNSASAASDDRKPPS
jgi:hypothetical protein